MELKDLTKDQLSTILVEMLVEDALNNPEEALRELFAGVADDMNDEELIESIQATMEGSDEQELISHYLDGEDGEEGESDAEIIT